jgi:hypothetical protein
LNLQAVIKSATPHNGNLLANGIVYIPTRAQIVLLPSEFDACNVKVTILLFVVVVVVNHKGGDVGSATFASRHFVNVLDGEAANAVGFDLAFALVEINDMLAVESFDYFRLLVAKEIDQVFFSEEFVHGVCFCYGLKISEKREKSRAFSQVCQKFFKTWAVPFIHW